MATEGVSDSRQLHWDQTYATKAPNEVSWFQKRPDVSLRLIQRVLDQRRTGSVVDVGGGASVLVDRLVDADVADVTVLDVSRTSLDVSSSRLGTERSGRVSWVTGDVLAWRPSREFDCWHDRAVFHFMVEDADQGAYVRTVEACVRVGGALVLGAFAADGPTQCSGLPTARYSAPGLAGVFAESFDLEHAEDEVHTTPSGATQHFTWVILRRRGQRPS